MFFLNKSRFERMSKNSRTLELFSWACKNFEISLIIQDEEHHIHAFKEDLNKLINDSRIDK